MAPKLKLKPLEMPGSTVRRGEKLLRPIPHGLLTMNTGSLENPFSLQDTEHFLFNFWAQEQVQIAGTVCEFFSQKVEKSTRDPLYDEPAKRVWSKAYRLKAWVSWASSSPVVGQEGFRLAFQTQAWIPLLELERVGAPAPFEGDVLRFWGDQPFFDETAAAGAKNIPKAGYYFDIVNADNDGHINDSPSFVGFRLDMKRRSEFGAERRISPP